MSKRLSKEETNEIIELYQNGMPPKDIGNKFGIYNNSVTRILRKNGIDRNQAAKQITKDQSLVAKLLEEGAITPEEAENHPRKNVILGSLGSEDQVDVDLFHVQVEPNDCLLLCSDGLTNYVRDKELADIIQGNELDEAPGVLISLANARGGGDNISVILIRINSVIAPTIGSFALEPPVSLWPFTFFLCALFVFIATVVWALMNA